MSYDEDKEDNSAYDDEEVLSQQEDDSDTIGSIPKKELVFRSNGGMADSRSNKEFDKPDNVSSSSALIINFDDVSDNNLDKLPFNIDVLLTGGKDNFIHAAATFIRDYSTVLTIKDPNKKSFKKKKGYPYADLLKTFSNRPIKLIDIDYLHFTDFINKYYGRMMKLCNLYQFEYPYMDVNRLASTERTDLAIYMYSKKLQEFVDKDKVEQFLKIMKHGALYVYTSLYDKDLNLDLYDPENKDKETTKAFLDMHIGLKNIEKERAIYQIKSDYINKAIVIKGDLVSYDPAPRVQILKSWWKCYDCSFRFALYGSNKPIKCANCGEKSSFEDLNEYETLNYIFIKVQQHMNSSESQIGVTDINVRLEGSNLIESFYRRMKPAANLKITGIVKLSAEKTNRNNPDERLLEIHALTVEIEGENTVVRYNDRLLDSIATKVNPRYIEEHFKKLERSICPHLHGWEPEKTAVLLQCVGAVARRHAVTKHRIRGSINLLFCGDPGVGKSEFGKFIEKIVPLSIRTIGGKSTTTKAALTTSSDIINGLRVITFGVLPRCDNRGIAIIDELDKREKDDFEILSIPMDDNQEIPTFKAGFHNKVMARCPVLLLGNANKKHGKWDLSKTIADQTNYAVWLLSRVDLVFVMVDKNNIKEKEKMVDHIASTRGQMISEQDFDKSYQNKMISDLSIEKIENDLVNNRFDGVYDTEYLRHEIHYLQQTYKPLLKPGSIAEKLLKKEYLRFSQLTVLNNYQDGDGPVSQAVMDARAYNGLERLSMAVARCRRHNTVEEEDMEKALALMLSSLTSMMPQPKQDTTSALRDGNIYSQFEKIISNKSDMKKILEQANAGWSKKKDDYVRKFRSQLTKFNQILFRRGFYNCKDCHGNGVVSMELGDGAVQSETCVTCKGKKVFRRKFTYYDFEADIVNARVMETPDCKAWWNLYRSKNIVVNAGGSTWNMGFDTIDNVYISDVVDILAINAANEKIQAEKERMSGGAGGIGPATNNNSYNGGNMMPPPVSP
jgi:replicative DNA helicase Mcm